MIDMIIASSLLVTCTFVVKALSGISREDTERKKTIIINRKRRHNA